MQPPSYAQHFGYDQEDMAAVLQGAGAGAPGEAPEVELTEQVSFLLGSDVFSWGLPRAYDAAEAGISGQEVVMAVALQPVMLHYRMLCVPKAEEYYVGCR